MVSKLTSSSRIILISIWILVGFYCSAQKSNNIIFSDSTQIVKPKAIPVLNVVKQIQEANELIKGFKNKIEPKNSIKKIDSLFPIQKDEITLRKKHALTFIEANPNKQKINNLLNSWNRYNDFLKTWETTVDDYFQKNARIIEGISFHEETWKLTLENSKTETIPNEIRNNINSVYQQFILIKNSLITVNNKYLTLESKIGFQISITDDIIEKLETLKTSDAYGLFNRRHEPLWQSFFKKSQTKLVKSDEASGLMSLKNTLNFFKDFEHLLYLYILLIIITIIFIRYLKKGLIKYEYTERSYPFNSVKDLIYNNTWTTIVFTSLIIAKFCFTNAPKLLDNILTLFVLIFTIPIVTLYITKKFKNIVFVIILFFIYNSIKAYIWFESVDYRIYLMFEALIVIISLYFFTKPYAISKKMPLKGLGTFFIKLTPVIYLLAITSITSNVLGYTNLADVSLKICTHGAAITVVFYAILRVVEGMVLALTHRHYASTNPEGQAKKVILEQKLLKSIQIIVLFLWVVFFLIILDHFNAVLEFFNSLLTEPYAIGEITITLGNIASFILILISSFLITSLVAFIIDGNNGIFKTLKLPKGVPAAISLVIRYIIIAFGIVFALSSLGVDLSQFNLMAGALGLGIGFGLQNVISNFVSGLILVFERPILPGDTIEVNNLLGNVKKIGIRSSNISTFDGADVVVPNNNLVSNDLINWTLSNNIKRIEILVGTTYNSDPNQVLEIMLNCAKDYKETMQDPAPLSLFSDFGESSLNFRLRFWVHFEIGLQAKSDVSVAIYNKFKEQGIEIPFPQQDVYIKDVRKNNEDELLID